MHLVVCTHWMYQYYVLYLAWWWLNEPKHIAKFLILITNICFVYWLNKFTILLVFIIRMQNITSAISWNQSLVSNCLWNSSPFLQRIPTPYHTSHNKLCVYWGINPRICHDIKKKKNLLFELSWIATCSLFSNGYHLMSVSEVPKQK